MELTPEQLAADENTSSEELTKLARQSIELARIVASNFSADSEISEELSINKDLIILQNLAANINTPPNVLQRLANTPIDKFLKHLINDWDDIKRKTNLSPFGNGTVKLKLHCQRLANLGISSKIINNIKEASKIYQHIARNPNTSINCLLYIGFFFPEEFLENPILPLLILENPNFIDNEYYLQIEIAKHPKTPVNILKYLIEYGRYGVRKYIAENPNTPTEFLEQMAEYAIEQMAEYPIGQELKFDETLEAIIKNLKFS